MTEGSSLSARHSLYAIGKQHTVDVIDPNPLCQSRFSSLAASFRTCPHYAREPEAFLRFLARTLKGTKYDVVLPPHEQVFLLSPFRHLVNQLSGLALSDFSAMEIMQHKGHFARLLEELDLPQPEWHEVYKAEDLDREWQYPFFFKLAHSTAGAGVFRIENRGELDALITRLTNDKRFGNGREAMVQQPAKGNQATVQVVYDQGRVIALHIFDARKLGVGGMSSARTSADHPIVREHMAKMGKHLNWHGALFIDYYYDYATARPEYIECNPRVGETVNAYVSGANVCDYLVRLSAGEQLEPLPMGQIGKRTQSFLMILITAAYQGASRSELRREWRAWKQGEGLYENAEDELTRPQDDPMSRLPLWWIGGQLLAWPKLSKGIVEGTINNYSLPEDAAERVRKLRVEDFAADFAPTI